MRALGFVDPSAQITVEDVQDRFRSVAKKTHPDVRGGSEAKFKEVSDAARLLLTILPSRDELFAKSSTVRRLEEKKLLGGPRGILSRGTLRVVETALSRLSTARDVVADAMLKRARSEARPPEVTGTSLVSAEMQGMHALLCVCCICLTLSSGLQEEMDELKREEMRAKGVNRLVDRLVSEALRSGEFTSELKGKPLPEDYYDAHLAATPSLERKLQAIMIDNGVLPEW